MATNFPGAVDDFTFSKPLPTDPRNAPSLAGNVVNLQDAIVATQTRLLSGEIVKVTTTQRDALTPTEGKLVFNTTTGVFNKYVGGSWSAVTLTHSELQGLTSDSHTQYALHSSGTLANRPAAGRAGRRYLATDLDIEFVDNGTSWIEPALVRRVAGQIDSYSEKVQTLASVSSTTSINFNTATIYNITLTQNTSLVFTNVPAGRAVTFVVQIKQDATGGRTLTFPAAVKWQGGLVPPVFSNPNAITLYNFFTLDGGATLLGFQAGFNFS